MIDKTARTIPEYNQRADQEYRDRLKSLLSRSFRISAERGAAARAPAADRRGRRGPLRHERGGLMERKAPTFTIFKHLDTMKPPDQGGG